MGFEKVVLGISLLLLCSNQANAHKPSYANDHNNPDLAFEVDDADISIVLYAEMTCTEDTLWMEVQTEERDEIWVELGVPELERLSDYRPSLAIVGEGLPEAELPFTVPDGMGATVIDTSNVTTPSDFYEPFTDTNSWILFSGWVDVPTDSTVYLVAWNPEEFTGKLWVAVGKVEDFSDVTVDDFTYWKERTSAFHEVDDMEEHMELDCSLVADETESSPEASTPEKGCSTLPSGHLSWAWMGLLGALWRRQTKSTIDLDNMQ